MNQRLDLVNQNFKMVIICTGFQQMKNRINKWLANLRREMGPIKINLRKF